MNIVIANRQRTKKINVRLLKQIVAGALTELKITEAELGINLVAAKEMTSINWQFLQHEGSTDVITFDHSENRQSSIASRQFLNGELFVCVDEALVQAKKFKTIWPSEVVRYIVHGILHLAGHDDLESSLRRKMKSAENRLCRRLAGKFSFAQLGCDAKLRA